MPNDPKVTALQKSYTSVRKTEGGWSTHLVVGVQSFCVAERRQKSEAKWFARMLAIAIKNLLTEESK